MVIVFQSSEQMSSALEVVRTGVLKKKQGLFYFFLV